MGNTTARRWLGRAGFAAGVVLATLGVSAAPASAHNYPVAYAPAEGSVVTTQPGVFSVTTNDNLLQLDGTGTGMAMQISGPAGAATPLYYGDGCVTVFGPSVETTAQLGAPGEYTVVWQVVSTDGHPVSGKYSFTWQPEAGQALAAGSITPPDCNGAAPSGPVQSTDAASPAAAAPDAAALAGVLWIGGALLAVLVAVVATLAFVRRKPGPPGPSDSSAAPPAK